MKQKRTFVTLLLVIAILCLGIGYAVITNQTLTINGSAKAEIGTGAVDVEFTNAKAATGSETKVTEAKVDDVEKTKASFKVEGLTTLNETASVEFTIANNSSDIPATLGAPNITLDKNEWFEVASTYSNANLAVKGQGGDSQTLTLTVKLIKVPTTEEAAAAASETITVSIVADPASNAN